jgi:hypothetical protein
MCYGFAVKRSDGLWMENLGLVAADSDYAVVTGSNRNLASGIEKRAGASDWSPFAQKEMFWREALFRAELLMRVKTEGHLMNDMLTGKFRLRLLPRLAGQPLLVLQTGWIDTGIATTPNIDNYWDRYTHWHDARIEDLRNAINLDFINMEIESGCVAVDGGGRPLTKKEVSRAGARVAEGDGL